MQSCRGGPESQVQKFSSEWDLPGGAPGAMRKPWFSESGSWLKDQPLGVKDRHWEDRSSYSNGTCPGGRYWVSWWWPHVAKVNPQDKAGQTDSPWVRTEEGPVALTSMTITEASALPLVACTTCPGQGTSSRARLLEYRAPSGPQASSPGPSLMLAGHFGREVAAIRCWADWERPPRWKASCFWRVGIKFSVLHLWVEAQTKPRLSHPFTL